MCSSYATAVRFLLDVASGIVLKAHIKGLSVF